MKQNKAKLEIKQNRIFSDEYKKSKVQDLIAKRVTVTELTRLLGVSRSSIYKWLYKYSPHHEQKSILVVQMESEATKAKYYMQRVEELERVIGQKQLEIDFLNKLIEIGSEELGFDIKKNFSTKLSNGTESIKNNTDGK